ncbi:hypothetical protein AMAG_20655 [Allomyces macrogynus ATCC 38327]|uniref:Mucoidy inhibitor A n=1 Tax=Allomyces macrogynus (strain ATCC 38327) TaxID=578462 RepID=A0A0L0TE32_ALLM3|nr:hypothetical protein AMAG_20655 [Allomyces macrogynus ATCC 38327]|eukprot:KNE72982.1 hypothetical protein AMAG_20655 [Allomyces macrogynus ATCC 38327]
MPAPPHTVTVDAAKYPINKVTVYQDRAEVKRTLAALALPCRQGACVVRVRGISDAVDSDSIRVDGRGDAVIVDVVAKEVYESLDDEVLSARAQATKDRKAKLAEIDRQLEDLHLDQTLLTDQAQVITNYAKAVTTPTSAKDASAQPLQGADVFFGSFVGQYANALAEIKRKLLTIERDIKVKNCERDALAEPSDAEGTYAPTSSRIQVVEVTLETKVTGDSKDETLEVDLDITYIVHRASWTPLYDLRVFSQSDSTKLTYAANVQQSTGEDWADVELTLSTAKVARSHGEAPAYKTRWTLAAYRPRPPMPKMPKSAFGDISRFRSARPPTARDMLPGVSEREGFGAVLASIVGLGGSSESDDEDDDNDDQFQTTAAEVAAGLTATAYRIPSAATIPSDDSQHRVTVALLDLPATLEHTACPKLDPTAYLTAQITNKSAYTWIAGPANVFLDRAFVAKSRLSMVLPGAKLITSLGPDPAVAVQYRPVEKFTESRVSAGLFTSSASDRTAITYTQRTVLENKNTTKAVTLTLADQIPTTTSSDIVVTLLDPAEKQIAKLASRDAAVDTDGVKAAGAVPANGSNASLNRAPRAPNVVLYEDLGIVEWKIELKPGEKREVAFKYAVSYPKRITIEGLDG